MNPRRRRKPIEFVASFSRSEAKAAQLKYFYNGPCKNGHDDVRFTSTGQCKTCRLMFERRWRGNNPAVVDRQRDGYYSDLHNNRVKMKESNRKRRLSLTTEEKKELKVKKAEWEHKNDGYYRRRSSKWRKDNPHKVREYVYRRRALKYGSGGTHTPSDIEEIFALQNERCAYCRAELDKTTRQVDHIEPLSKGGSNGRRNLQILCGPCNNAKRASDPIEFMQQRGMLL